MPLADKTCVPCKGGVEPLKGEAVTRLLAEIPEWTAPQEHHLFRAFKFPDFKTALAFVNQAGAIAEEQGHHPDILLGWGKAEVTIYTHTINGLAESDFILAAKINQLKTV